MTWFSFLRRRRRPKAAAELSDAPAAEHLFRFLESDNERSHPGDRITTARAKAIMRQVERGGPVAAYIDMVSDLIDSDLHLASLLGQRVRTVAGSPYEILPGDESDEAVHAAAVLRRAFARVPGVMDFIRHQLEGHVYSFACSAQYWGTDGDGYVVPVRYQHAPQRRFLLADDGSDEIRLIAHDWDHEGIALDPGMWVTTRATELCNGKTIRAGLMWKAVFFAIFKRIAAVRWVAYVEKYGIPLVYLQIAHGSSPEARELGMKLLDDLARGKSVQTGDAITVKNIDLRNAGNAEVIIKLILWCNSEMSKLVNGSTQATDIGSTTGAVGSNTAANAHARVRSENFEHDALVFSQTFLDHVSVPFMHYNRHRLGEDTAAPLFYLRVHDTMNPDAMLGRAQKMRKIGGTVCIDQMRRVTGLRAPVGDSDTAGADAGADAGNDDERKAA